MPATPAHILIIDDEEMVRFIVAHSLRRRGWTVDQACHGEEGLAAARRRRPDVIVCDVNMPVMDGIQTLAAAREDSELKTIPFLMITGLEGRDHEERTRAAGARAFLAKPFDNTALVGLIEEILGQHPGSSPPARR